MQQVRCSNIQERHAKQQNQFACTKIEEIGEPGARPALFLLKLCTNSLGQHLNEYQASPVLQYTRTNCESEKRQVIGYEIKISLHIS